MKYISLYFDRKENNKMKVNSIQNQNYRQPNFGCGYCEAAKVFCEKHGHDIGDFLKNINPESPTEVNTCAALKKFKIDAPKLHSMRAKSIFEGLKLLEKDNDIKQMQPNGLRKVIKAVKDMFDDNLQLRIGEDFE